MRPTIDDTRFGSITIDGAEIDHDVLIRLSGKVGKRKKKLSKKVFGTAHVISQEEAAYIFEEGMEQLIIGTGQTGMVTLSTEAAEYLPGKEGAGGSLPHSRSHSALEQGQRCNGRAFSCYVLIPAGMYGWEKQGTDLRPGHRIR